MVAEQLWFGCVVNGLLQDCLLKKLSGIENLFSNLLGKFVLIETGSLIKTLIYKKRAYREPVLNSVCTV